MASCSCPEGVVGKGRGPPGQGGRPVDEDNRRMLRNSPLGSVRVEAMGDGRIGMTVDRRAYTDQDPPPCGPAPDVPLVDLSATNRADIDNVFNPRCTVLVSRAVIALALMRLPG